MAKTNTPAKDDTQTQDRTLSPAAQRALEEAAMRRRQAAAEPRPKEIDGRDGPEPVRYGDWEVGGRATDF